MQLLVISDDSFFLTILKGVLNKNKIKMVGININSTIPVADQLDVSRKKTILVKLNKVTPGNILKVDRLINSVKGVHRIYALNALRRYEDQFDEIVSDQQEILGIETVVDKFKLPKSRIEHTDLFISNLINYNLSRRETDVIFLLSGGCSYKEVAAKLDLSIDTVRSHIKNVYSKLNVNSKSQAISKVMGYFNSN